MYSDSEDDADYVPPAEEESSSEDEAPNNGHVTEIAEPSKEDEEAKKAAKDALWASFQASVASTSEPAKDERIPRKLVKIEKRYKFAGEDVTEVVEVEEDSPDAKKWPLWHPTNEEVSTPQTLTTQVASAAPSTTPSKSSTKRAGPRKSKVLLSSGPPKPKKLSTLEKSAMDWKSHVSSETNPGLQDELEANRRGGGYLEKVDFLKRVEERKEGILETSRSAKRRKT